MNPEIRQAAANFPGGKLPEALFRFYEFLTADKPSGFLDYETITDGKTYLSSLLNENMLQEFIPFYVENRHDCYSIWLSDPAKKIEELPVMFNDTKGIYIICAADFNEFLFLLSKNIIGDAASAWSIYDMMTKMGVPVASPLETYTEEVLTGRDTENQKTYEDYGAFASFVKNTMGIDYENPIRLMANAREKYPDMVSYIRSKKGFAIDPKG
jgi:hypothetical protein